MILLSMILPYSSVRIPFQGTKKPETRISRSLAVE